MAFGLRLFVGSNHPDVPSCSRISFEAVGNIDHGVERRAKPTCVLIGKRSNLIDTGLCGEAGLRRFTEAGKADHSTISVRSVVLAPYCTD
ncbi:hypothetical protein [Pseudomonas sp. E102]|uniref:hypothetical protein n=1 Tax=Pseudomonas sp. E102 TaxID=181579 RepID=UPI004046313D